jgi:hypothetical protein
VSVHPHVNTATYICSACKCNCRRSNHGNYARLLVGRDFLVSDHGGQEEFDAIVTVQSLRSEGLNADARIYVGLARIDDDNEVEGAGGGFQKKHKSERKEMVYTHKAYRKHNYSDNLKWHMVTWRASQES